MRGIVEVFSRVAELERRVAGMVRHGTVAAVDPGKGLMRLKLGEATGGGDMLSPWVPYSQTAGALKAHIPPTVGQQFSMIAPSGDWRQAVAMPLTWSDDNGSPSSKGDENVITFGEATITLKGGELNVTVGGADLTVATDSIVVRVGGVSLTVSGGGVEIEGGAVRHNGSNIGDSHIHSGVERGGSRTDPPAN